MDFKKLMLKTKKGVLGIGDMYNVVMVFVLVGITLGIGLYVLDQFMGKISGADAINATNTTILALRDFSDWFGIIIIVVAAAIIIGLVVRSLAFRGRG